MAGSDTVCQNNNKSINTKHVSRLLQSVYGVPDDGQSHPSPVHISSQPARKTTREDVQKEVSLLHRSLPPVGLPHPSERQSATQTDELLPYLASSLLFLNPLSDYLPENPAGQTLHEGFQSGGQPDELHGAVHRI